MKIQRITSIHAGSVVLLALLLSSCAAGGSTIEISQGQVVGKWANPSGATVVFEKDGTFTSGNLAKVIPLRAGCADSLASGKWLLLARGTEVAKHSDPTGSTITLRPNGRDAELGCGIEASVQKDKGGINICLVEDPDQACSSNELLRKPDSDQ
ncbi:hypothetical protein [Kitasatospora sp. NPDC088351]|uniref:hypothetical protein n=1 Tax=Kitasatospora sp. NPDC088351 TaxID=3155180 RepID=UPI00341742E2